MAYLLYIVNPLL